MTVTTLAPAFVAAGVAAPPPPPAAVEALVRSDRVAFSVRSVERLGGDMRREVGYPRAEFFAGAKPGGVALEGRLQGVDPPLLSGPKPLVQLPAHAHQELEAFVVLVNLYLQRRVERFVCVKGVRQ